MTHNGLILDFGGVVTTDFWDALSSFCVRRGLAADAIARALRETAKGRDALAAVESGHISQREYETTLAGLLNVDSHGLLGDALSDLRPRSLILDFVQQMRSKGIGVAILSNSWGSGEYDPYRGYDLEENFDAVVISDQVRLRKPSSAIYLLTAEKLGLPPESCIFVDDTSGNLPAARELGMAVVHFTDEAIAVTEIERLLGLK